MASADSCITVAVHLTALLPRIARGAMQVSQGKMHTLRLDPPDLPPERPGNYRASPSFAGLPRSAGLISGFCSSNPAFASGFLQTPPHGDALASGS